MQGAITYDLNTSTPFIRYLKTIKEVTLAMNGARELNFSLIHMDNTNFATISTSSLAINQFEEIKNIHNTQNINKSLARIDLRRNIGERRKKRTKTKSMKENKRNKDLKRIQQLKKSEITKNRTGNKTKEKTKIMQTLKREYNKRNTRTKVQNIKRMEVSKSNKKLVKLQSIKIKKERDLKKGIIERDGDDATTTTESPNDWPDEITTTTEETTTPETTTPTTTTEETTTPGTTTPTTTTPTTTPTTSTTKAPFRYYSTIMPLNIITKSSDIR